MVIKAVFLLIFCFIGLFLSDIRADEYAQIHDPSGLAKVYAGKNLKAPVIYRAKNGEIFRFEWDEHWSEVYLKSGRSGWVQTRALRLHFTEKDLPIDEADLAEPSEIDELAQSRGFSYARDSRLAARGDFELLKKFFEIVWAADGAAAESVGNLPTVVYHLLGDEKFAQFLKAQPLSYRMMVRGEILYSGTTTPTGLYLSLHFPKTSALLFQTEMIDWPSPDGRYAIRKVFSNGLDLAGSKVVEAELIEKKSGRVLCNLMPGDIGTGAEREGEALWSSDSKRVVCLSSDLNVRQGNLFDKPTPPPLKKQVAVYQLQGDSFVRVELSLDASPNQLKDMELKGAIPGQIYTEPLSWLKPNVLLLRRHEYYQKIMPVVLEGVTFESIRDLAREYEITLTFQSDGKVASNWRRLRN